MKFKATVVHGTKVGAKFGIATANLRLEDVPELAEGVYLVKVALREKREERGGLKARPRDLSSQGLENFGDVQHGGLLHYGHRKTFGGEISAEVHILDFDQDLYGQALAIELGTKLREVKAFRNADALFTQIETDILMARKYFLRQRVWQCWAGLSLHDQQQLSQIALKHLSANSSFLEAQRVFTYAPQLNKEIGFVAGLMAAFPDKEYAFPRVDKNELNFYPVTSYAELKPGNFGILEPTKGKTIKPKSTDLMLVPSVAVTRDGERLGQGGGFYDRYLEALKTKPKLLSVVPGFAVVEEVPTEKHDQRLDGVVGCEI